MYQYDHPTAAATLPTAGAAGTPGYFTNGDPVLEVPRSVLEQDFMNTLMLEIMNVVTGTGQVLSKTNNSQLLFAIQLLVGANVRPGTMRIELDPTTPPGWVRANDGSIGSASSGATTRANADTGVLYGILWNNYDDTFAPVSTGRGASAAADFTAGKTIGLGTLAGRSLGVSGTGAGLTARAAGDRAGAEGVVMNDAQLIEHGHAFRLNVSGDDTLETTGGLTVNTSGTKTNFPPYIGALDDAAGHQIGSGGHTVPAPISVMQPTAFLNVFLKL